MAVYDLEEQEQLEDLKAWWRRWGNLISGVVIAVCVAIVGVQGWGWWQHNQAEQAAEQGAAIDPDFFHGLSVAVRKAGLRATSRRRKGSR